MVEEESPKSGGRRGGRGRGRGRGRGGRNVRGRKRRKEWERTIPPVSSVGQAPQGAFL